MNDTVRAGDIGFHNVRVADHHFAAFSHDRHVLTVDRFGFVQLHDVFCHDLARHDVIGQDRDQLVMIFGFEQVFDRTGRQLSEGLVRRRENREWTGAFERVDQSGCL